MIDQRAPALTQTVRFTGISDVPIPCRTDDRLVNEVIRSLGDWLGDLIPANQNDGYLSIDFWLNLVEILKVSKRTDSFNQSKKSASSLFFSFGNW